MKFLLKKLTCVVLTALIVMSLCAFSPVEEKYQITEPHVYDVLPGSDEWIEMTPSERYALCYVSEEEASSMTTDALLETVLTYPYFINIYAYDSPTLGIEMVSRYFPALPELLSRPDVIETLQFYTDQSSLYSVRDEINLNYVDAQLLLAQVQAQSVDAQLQDTRAANAKVKTPNGSYVDVVQGFTWSDWTKIYGSKVDQNIAEAKSEACLDTFPSAKILRDPDPEYNCHSYAWYSTSSSNSYWMDDPTLYMSDRSYVSSYAKSGNRVTYTDLDTDMLIHSAIVSSVSNGVAKAASKWGTLAVFSHNVFDCPYVPDYDPTLKHVATGYWSRN